MLALGLIKELCSHVERALTEMDSEHVGADFAYISTINACNNTDDSIIGPTLQIRKST